MRTVWLITFLLGCGARETYVPQPPNPQDFGVTGVRATADTADSGRRADTGLVDTGHPR